METKIQNILTEIRSRLQTFYRPRLVKILLYGSYARGDAEPGSDIDILVVLRGPVNAGEEISRTGGIVADLSLRFGEVVSCVFMDEHQFIHRNGPLLRNVRKEGVAI